MKTRKIKVAKKPTNISNISKTLNNNKLKSITPENWILQNKKIFPSWISTTFQEYSKPSKNTNINGKTFKPFPNQLFLKDYMANSSPYRGILLYHGLGTGKTCSSILIAENVKNTKNIIVLLPASLKDNFIQKGLKFCGDIKYHDTSRGNKLIEDTYYFISYNSPTKIKQLDKLGSLDNHLIIIEEIHNLISMMSGQSKQGKEIYQRLMDAKNIKIVGLSGTPLTNYPYESAIMFNLLRGYMEELLFTFNKLEGSITIQQLKERLENLEEVDLTEINMNNRTISIYLRNIATWSEQFKSTVQKIIDIVNSEFGIQLKALKTNLHTLFPEDEDRFHDIFIQDEEFRNRQIFQRRILGLVSYVEGQKEGYPEVIIHPPIKIPMSDYQFDIWESAREKLERPLERRLMAKSKSGKSTKNTKMPSTFRVYSRQFSNFVFPPTIPRPFPRPEISLTQGKLEVKTQDTKELNKLVEKENNVNNSENEDNVNKEKKKVVDKKYLERQRQVLEELKQNSNKYLTLESLQRYSPKLLEALKLIEDSPGLVLLYSNFRSLEGIAIMKLILEQAGYNDFNNLIKNIKTTNVKNLKDITKKINTKTFAIYSGQEDMTERAKTLKVFTNNENKYGKYIKVLMISGAGSEGLDLANVRRVIILEPHWGWVRVNQVIGRGARYHSHINLPIEEKKVDVYILLTTLTDNQLKRTREKQSTDEYIYDIALKKKAVLDELLQIMKETSVDCILNASDRNGNIRCFTFGDDVSPKTLAYLPDINRDIVYDRVQNTKVKEVKRSFIPALVDNRGLVIVPDKMRKNLYYWNDKAQKRPIMERPKEITKIYISGKEVYDFESIKSKNPILIGKIDAKGVIIKEN